jgi:hypothetical protein
MRDVREVLLQVRPTLANEREETLLRLSYRVWMPAMGAARHSADSSFCYFPARALEADFGRGGFKSLNEKHNLFEVLEMEPGTRWTRGFRLVPDFDAAVNVWLRRVDERLPVLITREGAHVTTLPRALASENCAGKAPKAWAGAALPNRVPVDFELLNRWASHLRRYINAGGYVVAGTFVRFSPSDMEAIKYREAVLSRLIALSNSTVGQRRYVPIRYCEEPCGRAFATGVNLQSAPRDIRAAALHGNWDLDLSNCHYSLLLQLGTAVCVDLPEVRWYLDNKETLRASLAARVGISEEEAKSCLIALIYGARFTLWAGADIPKLIGPARARKLYSDPQFRALKADVSTARKAILRAASRGPIVVSTVSGSLRVAEVRKLREVRLFNAVGNSITVLDRGSHRRNKRRPPAALLAHILLGLEAKVMRVIVDAYSADVLLLMHDGLVSRRELPVAEIEELIHQRTGLRMTVEQEKIEVPEELGDLGKLLERKSLRHLVKAEDPAHYGPPALVGGAPGLGPVVPVARVLASEA